MEGISLLSGGKDSIYATYIAMQQGIDVKKIISVLPEEFSYMYHFPNVHMTKLIAESLGLEFFQFSISDDPDELKDILSKFKEKAIISGAIESEYQKTRLERICHDIEKVHFSPLWRKDPFLLLNEILSADFNVIFVSVSAEGLDEKFLGRGLNYDSVEELKLLSKNYGIHPSGEGGEYETLVLDGPIFRKRIVIEESERIWNGSYGILNIKKARLEEK